MLKNKGKLPSQAEAGSGLSHSPWASNSMLPFGQAQLSGAQGTRYKATVEDVGSNPVSSLYWGSIIFLGYLLYSIVGY